MGAGWCLEAVPGAEGMQAGQVVSRHHFDSWKLVHLIQDLDAEPDLPDDVSLSWCEPVDPEMVSETADEEDAEAEEIAVWSVAEIAAGLRWLLERVASRDPRVVSKRDIERGEDKYLQAELNEALAWLARIDATSGVRCLATP